MSMQFDTDESPKRPPAWVNHTAPRMNQTIWKIPVQLVSVPAFFVRSDCKVMPSCMAAKLAAPDARVSREAQTRPSTTNAKHTNGRPKRVLMMAFPVTHTFNGLSQSSPEATPTQNTTVHMFTMMAEKRTEQVTLAMNPLRL